MQDEQNPKNDIVSKSEATNGEGVEGEMIKKFHETSENDFDTRIKLLAKLGKFHMLKTEASKIKQIINLREQPSLKNGVENEIRSLFESWKYQTISKNLDETFYKILDKRRTYFITSFIAGSLSTAFMGVLGFLARTYLF